RGALDVEVGAQLRLRRTLTLAGGPADSGDLAGLGDLMGGDLLVAANDMRADDMRADDMRLADDMAAVGEDMAAGGGAMATASSEDMTPSEEAMPFLGVDGPGAELGPTATDLGSGDLAASPLPSPPPYICVTSSSPSVSTFALAQHDDVAPLRTFGNVPRL